MRILETKIGALALLLPTTLRRPILEALAMWLVMPMQQVLASLTEWRRDTITRLGYNGQVCNLERCLNDLLDYQQRGISIVDGQQRKGKPYYVYERGISYNDMPQKRGGSPALILQSRNLIMGTFYDFEVEVPARVLYEAGAERRLQTLVNRYKLPSTRWALRTRDKD